MNYKNRYNGQVISEASYRALPLQRKNDWEVTLNVETHRVKDDGVDILTTAIIMSSMLSDDSPTHHTAPSDSGHSYGGGDFGGGGASGSFDSGSSSDGGGSCD